MDRIPMSWWEIVRRVAWSAPPRSIQTSAQERAFGCSRWKPCNNGTIVPIESPTQILPPALRELGGHDVLLCQGKGEAGEGGSVMEEGERVDKSPEDLDVNILLPDCGLGYKHQREDLDPSRCWRIRYRDFSRPFTPDALWATTVNPSTTWSISSNRCTPHNLAFRSACLRTAANSVAPPNARPWSSLQSELRGS